MNFRRFVLPLILFFNYSNYAQVIPAPGAKLNQTQVMLEHERVNGADQYLVQLREDTSGAVFEHGREQKDSSLATLISNLQFGKKYQWRYAGISDGKLMGWNGPYSFETTIDSFLAMNFLSLKVLKSEPGNSGLITFDCIHAAFDRSGNMVWYLPKINWHLIPAGKKFEMRPQIFDLKITRAGTVTFLSDSDAIETGLDGTLLWKGPNDGKISGNESEVYNHDFKRLPSGHYMVLGLEQWRKLPARYDTVSLRKKYPYRMVRNKLEMAKVEFGTIIEYNKQGEVVWNWNSENYFDKNLSSPPRDSADFELKAHMNAFSVDRKNEFVYAGFRDIHRVIKIDKKTGRVVYSWGDKLPGGDAKDGDGFFHHQHDAKILDDGTIAVFNNNNHPPVDSPCAAVIFTQPPGSGKSRIVWRYECKFDTMPEFHHGLSGGNVDELGNQNLLICMGNGDRVFEVTRSKQIVWDAIVQSNERLAYNFFHRLYRAHYISSLYPCYFTCQADKDTVSQKAPSFHLKIFNDGTEDDTYLIKISSSSGSYQKQFTSPMVNDHRSFTLAIAPGKVFTPGDKIQISVSSQTNPDVERKLVVVAGM